MLEEAATKSSTSVGPLFKDIPEAVNQGIIDRIREYSIGFTLTNARDRERRVDLLGSGTLVCIGDRPAILTAHHVAVKIPDSGRVGVLIDSSPQPQSLDRRGLDVLKIARGKKDSAGPDLAAVLLSEPIASSLRARKRFFDLDRHREASLTSPPRGEEGMWIVNGFLDERTKREKMPGYFRIAFHNQSGMGIAESQPVVGRYDYFFIPIDEPDRVSFPHRLNGMSGGGLWHAQLVRNKEGKLSARPPILQGVNFYQVPTTPTRCGLRCHGPQSVYKVAYEAIVREGKPARTAKARKK
jgi:hypothetical protein